MTPDNKPAKLNQINVRPSDRAKAILDALTYLEGASANDVLGPVVEEYLERRASEPAVIETMRIRDSYQIAMNSLVTPLKPRDRMAKRK